MQENLVARSIRSRFGKVSRQFRVAACALCATAAMPSFAGTNGFIVPIFRGSTDTRFGYWEIFASAHTAGNGPDQPGGTTSAVLTQSDTNAFVTGSGNIYNLNGASAFTVADSTPFSIGAVVLQARTVGSELDYNSVSLIYSNGTGTHTVAPLFRYELHRAASQGLSVSSLWQWDLSGLNISSYSISFSAAGPSLSFDSMTLDTAAQFAPAFVGQPFQLRSTPATIARWMYPFNGSPGDRPTASTFGSLGSNPNFDSRDAQYLLGWKTTNKISAGQGAKNYLLRRARVTLTIASGNQYVYSGSLRDYRSYFPTNDPRYVAPQTPSSPVELFGVGFRGVYTAATFQQDTTFFAVSGGGNFSNRTAFAAGFDTNGLLVDVSNNVGDNGISEIPAPFEVSPFAVGQTTNVAAGQLMPLGSQLTFDLNLDDPLIYSYLQEALNSGTLLLTASSFVKASFGGPPTYPNFYTIFSAIALPGEFPLLDIEGGIIRKDLDADADGLPDGFENFYFGSLLNTATNDLDGDGLNNLAEYLTGTRPTAAASALRLVPIKNQNAAIDLQFSVAPGRRYNISYSDELQNWQTITNPALSYTSGWLTKSANGTYPAPILATWRGTNRGSSKQFFRVTAE
jgi:hypothetical protein